MNYKLILKVSLIVVLVISAISVTPSLLRAFELPDSFIRILGILDIVSLFVLIFAFVRSHINH